MWEEGIDPSFKEPGETTPWYGGLVFQPLNAKKMWVWANSQDPTEKLNDCTVAESVGEVQWRSFSDEGHLEQSIDPFALIMGLIVRIPECKICPWLLSREEVGWRYKEKEEGLEHARHILSPQACWYSSSKTPVPFGDLLHSIRRGRRSNLVFSFSPSSLLFFGGLVFVFLSLLQWA